MSVMDEKDVIVDRIRNEMVDYLKAQDAFWSWQGHKHVAKLASGKLSDFFANLSPLFTNIFLQEKIGWALVHKAFHHDPAALRPDNLWVIGPAMGAIGLAQSVARAVYAYNPKVRCGYVEKMDPVVVEGVVGYKQSREMQLKRFDLEAGHEGLSHVILVEDVTTTGGTTRKTANALHAKHGSDAVIHNRVLTVVDRRADEGDLPFVSLMRVRPCTWDSIEDLPADLKNCVPIRPKDAWQKLVTEML